MSEPALVRGSPDHRGADALSADGGRRGSSHRDGLGKRLRACGASLATMQALPTKPAPRRWTLDQWAALDEDESGELVDGVIVEDEMAGWAHEVVVTWLLLLLGGWARGHGARVAGSDLRIAVSPSRGRKPDIVVYLAGALRPSAERGPVRVAPSIVVEVVSPSPSDARRDRIAKLDEYAAFGVSWYWIVDPELRTLEIFERGSDGRYVRAIGTATGRLADVPGCAGLVLDIDALWADLDAAMAEGS